jgi:hypothetical protein
MIANHSLGEGTHFLVLALSKGLLAGLDIELPRGIGSMGNLRVSGLCSWCGDGAGKRRGCCAAANAIAIALVLYMTYPFTLELG